MAIVDMENKADISLLPLRVKSLGVKDYEPTWRAMQTFTDARIETTKDEVWLVEHPPVFTLGQAGKPEHILDAGDIPIVQVDRGGQVTYHGPGQLVMYPLLDLKRRKLGVRDLVCQLEQAVINLLSDYSLTATRESGKPGVYIDGQKIAALGLRVRRGCSFHGLALNVDMDLEPYQRINPCGFSSQPVIDLLHACQHLNDMNKNNQLLVSVAERLLQHFSLLLGYTAYYE